MKTLIIRPVITEKSMQKAAHGWFTFVVDIKATKPQIAHEVARLFAVDVLTVRTVITQGKVHRVTKKAIPVKRSDWKKAFVQIKEGQMIDAFQLTEEATK